MKHHPAKQTDTQIIIRAINYDFIAPKVLPGKVVKY